MDFLVVIIIIGVIVFIYANGSFSFNIISPKISYEPQPKFQNAEPVKVLLNLDEKSLDELFVLYREKFGRGLLRQANL